MSPELVKLTPATAVDWLWLLAGLVLLPVVFFRYGGPIAKMVRWRKPPVAFAMLVGLALVLMLLQRLLLQMEAAAGLHRLLQQFFAGHLLGGGLLYIILPSDRRPPRGLKEDAAPLETPSGSENDRWPITK